MIQKLAAAVSSADSRAAIEAWTVHGLFKDADADAAEALLSQSMFSRQDLAMEAAGAILQLAPPEAVLQVQINLPRELSDLYLNKQEHFDLMKVLLNTTPSRRGVAGNAASLESVALDNGTLKYAPVFA